MRPLCSFMVLLNFVISMAYTENTLTSQPPTTTTAPPSESTYFPSLQTGEIQDQSGPAGDPSSTDNGAASSNQAGAAGSDNGSFNLSRGGMIAIIVVVVLVVIFGVTSSVLFYLAKKRSWEVRANIRKSARKVAAALTPRRSEFPKSVKTKRRSSRGLMKIDEVPPTPKMRNQDIEKGNSKFSEFEMSEPKNSGSKWARKLGR